MSQILNCGINQEELSICVGLTENGANPESLASVIKEIKANNVIFNNNYNNTRANVVLNLNEGNVSVNVNDVSKSSNNINSSIINNTVSNNKFNNNISINNTNKSVSNSVSHSVKPVNMKTSSNIIDKDTKVNNKSNKSLK
jgi:hypothetical protein